jgi:hypothetical protein
VASPETFEHIDAVLARSSDSDVGAQHALAAAALSLLSTIAECAPDDLDRDVTTRLLRRLLRYVLDGSGDDAEDVGITNAATSAACRLARATGERVRVCVRTPLTRATVLRV